ncbi:MAG: hypothetical protein HRU37_08505 [Roseibacillus sp.]|nr:hypothetical protein [Roseibacillus sp.]
MSKLAITLQRKALLSILLLLPGGSMSQIIQTLPEIRVTASADGAGAGEGDLDETVLAPEDLERFGVATLDGDRVTKIVEKPQQPETNLAVIGIYMYDERVWDIIGNLEPSKRGEMEITDVNNWYIDDGSMTFEVLEGWWTDAGTFESLHRASNLVADGGANKVGD